MSHYWETNIQDPATGRFVTIDADWHSQAVREALVHPAVMAELGVPDHSDAGILEHFGISSFEGVSAYDNLCAQIENGEIPGWQINLEDEPAYADGLILTRHTKKGTPWEKS